VTGATARPGHVRGRPRDLDIDRAVLVAAGRLLDDLGYRAMTVDAVARAADVSKAAIYRRWPSKRALAVDAVASRRRDADVPETGDAHRDLVNRLAYLLAQMTSPSARSLRRLFDASASEPEIRDLVGDEIVAADRAWLARPLHRLAGRGAARDARVQVALDLLLGVVLARAAPHGRAPDRTPHEDARSVVDLVLHGLARAAGPGRGDQ
jgi:AcrR family transcriptional regulator